MTHLHRHMRHVVRALLVLCLFAALAPAALARDSSGRVVFLHYWTGAMSGGVAEMVDAFNRLRPHIPLLGTGFEHESFKVGIRPMLASQQPPDIFSYWAGARTQALADAGMIVPIDDVWNSHGLDRRFSPAVAQACTHGGKKYAVPLTQHYVALFYDKKLFADLGLVPPSTWEEFLAACARIKAAGRTPVALGARDKWPAQFWFDYLLLATAGSDYRARLMRGQASYRDPETARVFALWRGLLDNGYLTPQPGLYDWAEAAKSVVNGQAAMTLMGTWVIGLFEGKLGWKEGVDFDFFPFPRLDPKLGVPPLGPIDVALVARNGDTEAAKTVAGFFAEVGPQQAMSRGSGALSPSRDIPAAFYSGLRSRILKEIAATPGWEFNYDLATPPGIAQAGLDAFAAFLANPAGLELHLGKVEEAVRACRQEGACRE